MIADVLLCGLGAAYATVLLRLLPGIRSLTAEGRKPFACDVCMSFWASLPLTLHCVGLCLEAIPAQLAAAGVSYALLTAHAVLDAARAKALRDPFR